jgi:hypothetical protein
MSDLCQGARANDSGKTFEGAIEDALLRRGFEVAKQVVVGCSIYETPVRVDMFVSGVPDFNRGLVIECKWQSVGGSVDEKYPYLVQNIRSGCYGCPVLIVLDGNGARPGAEAWLRRQVDGKDLVQVFSLAEFLKWVMTLDKFPSRCFV